MIPVLIQVSAGSRDRHVYDEHTLTHAGIHPVSGSYPEPCGFVVGTAAADSEGVDCYLLTRDHLEPGSIVDCEPIGLLLQKEGGEIDPKVLGVLPGQEVEIGPSLLSELQAFISALFAGFPAVSVSVGPIFPREAALRYIQILGRA